MDYAVIYARQSSEEGAKKNLSIPAQIQACKSFIEDQNYVLYKIFKDEGISGSHLDRPALQDLLRLSKLGYFKYVIVYDVSRLSRRTIDAAVIEHELQKNNVKLKYLDMVGMDETVKPVIKAVMQAFAELHSRQSAKKTKDGMIQNLKQGYWNGGVAPFGYQIKKIEKNDSQRSIIIKNDEVINFIKHYFKMRLNGGSIKEGIEYLEMKGIRKSYTGMRAIETNALFYAGFGIWGKANHRYRTIGRERFENNQHFKEKKEWIIIPNHHPAIITEKEANIILGMKRIYKREKHLLTGIAYCAKCKRKLWHDDDRLYCPNKHLSIYGKVIETELINFIQNELFSEDYIEEIALKEYKNYYVQQHKSKNNSQKIKALKSKINNLANAISMVSEPSMLVEKYEKYIKELKELEIKESNGIINLDDYLEICKEKIAKVKGETLKNILKILNFKVIIYPLKTGDKTRRIEFLWYSDTGFLSAGDGTLKKPVQNGIMFRIQKEIHSIK